MSRGAGREHGIPEVFANMQIIEGGREGETERGKEKGRKLEKERIWERSNWHRKEKSKTTIMDMYTTSFLVDLLDHITPL